MGSNSLQDKVAGLPDFVQQQIADYIDFLVQKYQKTENSLSQAEKQVLEERYVAYSKNPGQATELDDVMNRLTRKYGLPDQD
jgi:hypothetical protein